MTYDDIKIAILNKYSAFSTKRSEMHFACRKRVQYPYPSWPLTWRDGGPRGASSAFVFNELRRCSFPITQGVAPLFVSSDRFVGKEARRTHARFATFRGYYVQCAAARLLGHGILSTREQDISRNSNFHVASLESPIIV